jgi:hypothetical protein
LACQHPNRIPPQLKAGSETVDMTISGIPPHCHKSETFLSQNLK